MAAILYLKDKKNITDKFDYNTNNTLPFAWVPKMNNNKPTNIKDFLWIGKKGKTHKTCEYLNDDLKVDDLINRGRLWISTWTGKTKFNIISYWDINSLNKNDIKNDINELSKKLNINFDDWKIDLGTTRLAKKDEIIPIKEFIGVEFNENEIKLRNLIKKYHSSESTKEKNKIKQILFKKYNYDIDYSKKYFGSNNKNYLTAKQRFYKYMYNENNVKSWKQFLNESNYNNRYLLLPYDEYNEDFDKYDIDEYDAVDKAFEIAKNCGVSILRNKRLSGILIDAKFSKIIGAIWISDNNNIFSFDIAIDSSYQNMGLSNILIKNAISEYQFQKDMYDDMGEDFKMLVDVINPKLAKILKNKYGFYVVRELSQNRVLMSID